MALSFEPTSPNIFPISSRPLAIPHFGNITWASVANSSRMLSPADVTPPLSNALRYPARPTCAARRSSSASLVPCVLLLADRLSVCGARGPVRERDDRPERGAAGPVGPRGGRGDAVSDAVEARDRLVEVVHHLAVGRGLRAALGVQRAAGHQRGVIRPA